MVADGRTVTDAAERLGRSPKTVREIVERVGMADGFRRNSDRRLQQKKRAKERIAVLRHGDGRDR